jgi:hypothetical protein
METYALYAAYRCGETGWPLSARSSRGEVAKIGRRGASERVTDIRLFAAEMVRAWAAISGAVRQWG